MVCTHHHLSEILPQPDRLALQEQFEGLNLGRTSADISDAQCQSSLKIATTACIDLHKPPRRLYNQLGVCFFCVDQDPPRNGSDKHGNITSVECIVASVTSNANNLANHWGAIRMTGIS
jgi:hypothetical protein